MTAAPIANSAALGGLVSTQVQHLRANSTDIRPRLLVSVRSRREAERALAGGAEILDVKEPSLGSLGMAAIDEINAIGSLAEIESNAIPLSVALGELADWNRATLLPALPSNLTFAKLGLSQCGFDPNWQRDWMRIRAEFDRQTASSLRWVAVAYADAAEAASPSVSEVLQAAIETNCAGLLIDTWTKDGRVLLDEIDTTGLISIAQKCRDAGLFLALAGRVNSRVLAELAKVPADIIAIRSAACRGNDRTSELDSQCVTRFKKEMQEVLRPHSKT